MFECWRCGLEIIFGGLVTCEDGCQVVCMGCLDALGKYRVYL
jgi:hypothetical protein